jgi:ECF transporter S component (folate family)
LRFFGASNAKVFVLVSLLFVGGFFMSNWVERLFFSPFVLKEKRSRKIAYVAMMIALSIVCNIFFDFKLGAVQYSLTTAVSCLIGVLLGPVSGFVACFIGDMVGFFVNPFGAYTPWIGLSTGLMAFISGLIFHLWDNKNLLTVYAKCAIVAIATFVICS